MTAPDTLPRELAELGELLREDPPRPDPGWARRLDERAAAGFPEPPRAVRRARSVRRWRFPALRPALGSAALVIVVAGAIGYASTLDMSSDDSGGSSGGGASGGGAEPALRDSAGEESSGSGGGRASRPESQDAPDSASGSSPLSRPVPPPGGGNPGSDSRANRRVERSAALTLGARAREIDAVADGVVRVTDSLGGFVASSSVYGSSGAEAYGSFELRIPADRLQRALAELSRLAHVRERSQSSQDITAQTVSARDRLQEERRERQALLRQLGAAVTINETDSIKARLRLVNRRIAAARADLRRVDNRARFANVAVTLVADAGAGAAPGDGTWTPGDALADALRVLEVALGVLLIALAVAIPLALVGGFGWLAARVAVRRRRERALDLA